MTDPRKQFPDGLKYRDIEAELVGERDTILVRDITPNSAFPAVWMTLDEARALHDWLKKVLFA